MCTRARLAGAIRDSFFFSLLLRAWIFCHPAGRRRLPLKKTTRTGWRAKCHFLSYPRFRSFWCTALTGFARAHVIRFCFTLLLTSQRTLLLLHKERRHRSPWLTPADSCVSNDSEEEAQQGERRVIIPEPPGLELLALPDFLFPRSVETEARWCNVV